MKGRKLGPKGAQMLAKKKAAGKRMAQGKKGGKR